VKTTNKKVTNEGSAIKQYVTLAAHFTLERNRPQSEQLKKANYKVWSNATKKTTLSWFTGRV